MTDRNRVSESTISVPPEFGQRKLGDPSVCPPTNRHCDPYGAGYAAKRWAAIIIPVAKSNEDIANIVMWADQIGAAPSTIKAWCAVAGVRAKTSLDFARGLRIVQLSSGQVCNWHSCLSIVSGPTLSRFVDRCGMTKSAPVPALDQFLASQRLVADAELLNAIRQGLTQLPTVEAASRRVTI